MPFYLQVSQQTPNFVGDGLDIFYLYLLWVAAKRALNLFEFINNQ